MSFGLSWLSLSSVELNHFTGSSRSLRLFRVFCHSLISVRRLVYPSWECRIEVMSCTHLTKQPFQLSWFRIDAPCVLAALSLYHSLFFSLLSAFVWFLLLVSNNLSPHLTPRLGFPFLLLMYCMVEQYTSTTMVTGRLVCCVLPVTYRDSYRFLQLNALFALHLCCTRQLLENSD